jgi:hypothetical protein
MCQCRVAVTLLLGSVGDELLLDMKQNLVAHFETIGLQLYMMFLAFSMQLVSPKQ